MTEVVAVLPVGVLTRHSGPLAVKPDDGIVKVSWTRGDDTFMFQEKLGTGEYTWEESIRWFQQWRESCNGTLLWTEETKNFPNYRIDKVYDFLEARKPTTFKHCKVLYFTELAGTAYAILQPPPGRTLSDLISKLLGGDSVGYVDPQTVRDEDVLRLCGILDKVAKQTADAVKEMSGWEGEKYGSVLGGRSPDPNFVRVGPTGDSDPASETKWATHDEIVKRCTDGHIELTTPRFCYPDLSRTYHIIVDKENNFVGFKGDFEYAGFAPKDWAQSHLVHCKYQGIAIYASGVRIDVVGDTRRNPGPRIETLANLWRVRLSSELEKQGFKKLDEEQFKSWRCCPELAEE